MTGQLRYKLAVFFGLLVLTSQAGAQSIYSQSPPDPTTARTSDFAYSFVNQQAQSFTLAADASVQAVAAWGHYSSGLPNDNFTIRFYSDAAGSPETTPFAQLSSVTAIREDSGLDFSQGQDIYKYTINLNTPVALTAGTTYYFSIVNNTTDAEHWNWTGFSGGNNQRWNRLSDTSAWGPSGAPNLAFELFDAPIPIYSIGFTVSGLVPSNPVGAPENSIQLSNNGGDNITVFTDGSFSFPTELTDGAGYNITIVFQPDNQTCRVNTGTGQVNGADVIDPTVICDPPVTVPPATTAKAVPVMPLWLIGFMAIALAALASRRLRRQR